MSGKGGNSISPVSSTRIQLESPWTIVEPRWFQLIDYNGFNVVEAGGVEPPSEKRCAAEPTCLSQFRSRSAYANRCFASRAQNEQETQPASPMNLARALRTERHRPAHCVTPRSGPMSKARGSVRLIN